MKAESKTLIVLACVGALWLLHQRGSVKPLSAYYDDRIVYN